MIFDLPAGTPRLPWRLLRIGRSPAEMIDFDTVIVPVALPPMPASGRHRATGRQRLTSPGGR